MSMQDGIRAVQQALTQGTTPPRWPMYVRQAKQFLKTGIEGFDERKYGFASVVDLLRAAAKEGVLRLERDRRGAVRVFAGANIAGRPTSVDIDGIPVDIAAEVVATETFAGEPVEEPPIVDAETIEQPAALDANATTARKGARKRKAAAPRSKAAKAETTDKPPRARGSRRTKTEAADTP